MRTVDIELTLSRGLNWPNYKINLPQVGICDLDNHRVVTHRGQAKELLVNYVEKPQCETLFEHGKIIQDQWIKISALSIDGIKIHACMLDLLGMFTARYRNDYIEFCQQNNISVLAEHPTAHFWHAGTWFVSLDDEYWARYQQQRLSQNKSQSNDNFIGYSNVSKLLIPLKELLC